jgi:mono/diheme cytochrome c family protein
LSRVARWSTVRRVTRSRLALALAVVCALCAAGAALAAKTPGNAAAGKAVFKSAGCGTCHTLKAAGAHGYVGPNLDALKPSYAAIVKQVTNGGGAMPAFKSTLSKTQIQNVAAFVYASTHKK